MTGRLIGLSFIVAAVITVAGAVWSATFQGTQNPYGRGVTVTVPSGTYAAYDSPTTTGLHTHTGDASVALNQGVGGALVVGGASTLNGAVVASTDAGVLGNLGVTKSAFVTSDAGIGGNLGVTGALVVTGASTLNGLAVTTSDAGVGGVLGTTGGLVVGSGGALTSKIVRGTGDVWAGDAGVAEGACEADKTVTVTGATTDSECLLGKSGTLAAAGYQCQTHVDATNSVHVSCCCVGTANCAYVASASLPVICFVP